MNWEAISSVAEVVGAVAVVVSLIYLAIQVRQNTKQVEENAKGQRLIALGALGDHWRGFRANILGDRDTSRIWRQGNQDLAQLEDDERTTFDFLMLDLFWGFAYNWMMGVEEGLGEYLRDEISDNLLIYDSPGLREWWRTSPHKKEYPREFAELVDGLLRSSDQTESN